MDAIIDKIIKYERGDLDQHESVQFIQELIDQGLAWKLQGRYGRTATLFIEAGLCTR
jgi:hypothetical protein